jgi:hypothetical protein
MRYKISKENEVENYCSQCKVGEQTYFLLKCETGKSLKELGETPYELLLMLMNYQVLEDLNNGIYNDKKPLH